MEEIIYQIRGLSSRLINTRGRDWFRRYVLPIILVAIISALKIFLFPSLGDHGSFMLTTTVIIFSSWYGGLGPGIFATLFSAVTNFLIYFAKEYGYRPDMSFISLTVIYVAEGIIISVLSQTRAQLEEQKNNFIGFVAHELKNPLTAIKGYTELISSTKAAQRKSTLAYVNEINRQSDILLELINDFLDVTKIEIGKFNYRDELFELDSLVKEIVNRERVINKHRKIILTGKSKRIIKADRYRIGQVVTNLIGNALKYSPQNAKVIVKTYSKKGKAGLSVKDYGVGISMKNRKKLFNLFYRTAEAQLSEVEGLGLGLYICQQIIHHYKGTLSLKSRLGSGSTFSAELRTES